MEHSLIEKRQPVGLFSRGSTREPESIAGLKNQPSDSQLRPTRFSAIDALLIG